MSILQTIKDWLLTVCELTNPPGWLNTFVDAFAVAILVVCVIGLIWLAFSVLRWIFTVGGK